jgi:hypothetical protein
MLQEKNAPASEMLDALLSAPPCDWPDALAVLRASRRMNVLAVLALQMAEMERLRDAINTAT